MVKKILYYMRIFGNNVSPFFVSMVAVIAASILICIFTISCSANTVTFETTFYFVYYANEENAISASSISGAVSSYGGAGYVLEYNGNYYVTVACYYNKNDAEKVCKSLKKRDLYCEIIEISTDKYTLSSTNPNTKQLYQGNLNTLQSLSALAYECANKLDTGEYGQNQAKSVISDIENGIKGLLSANADNCFSEKLRRLKAECNEAYEGYVYSKDLRKLQIAIADVIINIKLN